MVRDRIHPTVKRVPLTVLKIIAAYSGAVLFLTAIIFIIGLSDTLDSISEPLKPRIVTKEQSERLREYLSKYEPSSVSIQAILHDQEAIGYASQIFSAMRQTTWDVDPPNHDGPAFLRLQPYEKRPKPDDVDANGRRLYRNFDDYLNAHDEWIESEIRRKADEESYPLEGIQIYIESPGQPANPDPRHPRPETVLADAMNYSGIEVNGSGGSYNHQKYVLYIRVGHKPRGGGQQRASLRNKIVQWLMRP